MTASTTPASPWLLRLRRLLLWVAVFSPALLMARLVRENAVDIGCWDMWENAPLLEKWHEGKLTASDMYAAQIQHRIVVPRLLILALHHLTGGDFRAECWAAFSMLLLAAILLCVLLRKTLGNSRWVPGLAFVVNTLLFCPMLYQNVLWGSSLWMSIPAPCLIGALLLLGRENAGWRSFAGAVILIEIASHSFSHGLAMWPLVLAYILAQPSLGTWKRRGIFAAVWAGIAAVTIGLYLTNFYNQAFHAYDLKIGDHALSGGVAKSLSAGTQAGGAGRAAGAFFMFLGSVFSRNPFDPERPVDRATLAGALLLTAFLAAFLALVATRRGRALWRQALPWLALGSYALGIGLLVAFGRTATGEFRALTPRYIVVALYLPLASLALWFLLVREFLRHPALERRGEFVRRAAVAGLAAVSVFMIPIWQYGGHLMWVWKQSRLQAKGLAMFIDTLEPPSWTPLDKEDRHGHQLDATAHIRTLRKLGLFKTPVFEKPLLAHFKELRDPLKPESAGILSADLAGDILTIRGHARFSMERPADLVLLADSASGTILALGQPRQKPQLRLYGLDYEFAEQTDWQPGDFFPWNAVIASAALPDGESMLHCWALDVQAMAVRRIPSAVKITRTACKIQSAEVIPTTR